MAINHKETLSLDHVLLTVNDYEKLLVQYQQLGFSPSPVSYHPWGTATCFMMFDDNFIELIGVNDATKFGTNAVGDFCFGRRIGEFLARGEDGISMIALHSKDTRNDYAQLKEHLPHQGVIDFRREITLDNGEPDEVVVTIGLLLDSESPEASSFICQQHRPDLIWVDEWRHHPNGASHIACVTYVADDFSVLRERWTLAYGDRVNERAGILSVQTGSGELRSVTPEIAQNLYAGIDFPVSNNALAHVMALTIVTRDMPALRQILDKNHMPYKALPGRVFISPQVTGNIILELIVPELISPELIATE